MRGTRGALFLALAGLRSNFSLPDCLRLQLPPPLHQGPGAEGAGAVAERCHYWSAMGTSDPQT